MYFIADAVGFLTFERQSLFKPGGEGREVRVLAGRYPRLLRHHTGLCQLLHQRLGQFFGTIVGSARLSNVGRHLTFVGRYRAFQRFQQVVYPRRGETLVSKPSQQGKLITSICGGLGRKLRSLIPSQNVGYGRKNADLSQFDDQGLVCFGDAVHRGI